MNYLKKIYSMKTTLVSIFVIAIGFAILVAGNFVENQLFSSILSQVSTALIPAGIISMLYDFYLRQDFVDLLKEEISKKNNLFKLEDSVKKVGMQKIYIDRSEIDFLEYFKNAKNEILILDTSLIFFTAVPQIETIFANSVENGCHIKLLCLDPNSNQASYRERDIGYKTEIFVSQLKSSIAQFQELKLNVDSKKPKGSIEIKMFDATTTNVLIMSDNRMIVGYILRKIRGRHCVHIEFTKDSENKTYEAFYNHFMSLWEEARDV